MARRLKASSLLVLAAVAFLLLAFFLPLVLSLHYSLYEQGQGLGPALQEVVQSPYYRGRVAFTFYQALLSTLSTLALGLPSAYLFGRYRWRGQGTLKALLTVPFVMPTLVAALGFYALLGPSGLVNRGLEGLGLGRVQLVGTLGAILAAHVFFNYAVVVRLVSSFWANLAVEVEEAARVLGAGRWRAFTSVTLPLLAPSIAAAGLLTFVFSFTSFGVIKVLGNATSLATLEVLIFQETTAFTSFSLPRAAVLAIIQLAVTLGVMVAYARLQHRTTLPQELRAREATARLLAPKLRWLALANFVVVGLVVAAPLGAVAVQSFQTGQAGTDEGSRWTLDNYRAIWQGRVEAAGEEPGGRSATYVPPDLAVRNTLLFGLGTVALALPLGLVMAYTLHRRGGRAKPLLDGALMLPLGVSAITLAYGLKLGLRKAALYGQDHEGLTGNMAAWLGELRVSPWLIILAHTLIAYPFVVRALLPLLGSIKGELKEVAALLGARPGQVFAQVELPLLGRGLLVGATFAFAISAGEFGATLLLRRAEWYTMPLAIFDYFDQPAKVALGQAYALSTLLMVVAGAAFVLIERFRYRGVGEF